MKGTGTISLFRYCSGRLKYLALFYLVWLAPGSGFPQLTKIIGTVTDAVNKEPIPFVNILIKGTDYGMLTGFDGKYSMELKGAVDSIRASLIGYRSVTRKIIPNQFQVIDFELQPEEYNLPEVVIRYRGNPAEVILEKIIRNKKKNSIQSFESYQHESYTKLEMDANNISERLRYSRLLKPMDFVFNYIDTSTINGKSYLPVFLTETRSDIYFRKSPRARKEIIKGSRISGLENESVAQFLGNLSMEIDIYKDYLPIFEKNFVSPIADFGIDFYKYYLVDSTFIGHRWCYHIMFKPRRKQELTFTGSFWVNDTTFAIVRDEMRIAEDANLNFINDLSVKQDYEFTGNRSWMLTRDELLVDFNIIENSKRVLGFYGHRTTFNSNFQFDIPETGRFLSLPSNIFTETDAQKKDEAYWEDTRPEPLSESEKGIYEMVDSVTRIPIFRTYVDIVYGVVNGYLKWGKFEIGPYFKLYSFNDLEGSRFRIGGRTANSFSKRIQLQGYVAYGTKDQTLKYSADIIGMVGKNPRRVLTALYKYDVEQLGMSPNAFASDNILSSLFHRGPNNKLTMTREYKVAYEHEWFNGLSNTLTLTHREVFPLGSTDFTTYPDGISNPVEMASIYTSEIQLGTRISWKEKFVSGEFYRYTISSYYPIIRVNYAYGIPDVFKSDFEYHKLTLNISQWFNFSTIGWSKYMLEAGKIWGRLPYPLLRIHDGNQTLLYDDLASNLMNYYEFASDAYFSLFYTHHFDGLLFNKIPLIRKLKWREVVHMRAVYGTLTDANATYSQFPDHLRSFSQKPYWEAGAGIENIFRIIRVDAVWRLSHLNDYRGHNPPKFGAFISLNFAF